MTEKLKNLQKLLESIDGEQRGSYKKITGDYDYGDFNLKVDFVPDDPTKYPARLRVRVPLKNAKFPKDVFNTKSREIAARDFLARSFGIQAARCSMKIPGGSGGRISIDRPGQEILETSAIVVGKEILEARFTIELPLERGKIPGPKAFDLFVKRIPVIVRRNLFYEDVDGDRLADWLETAEDADALRNELGDRGLVAFIADGSILQEDNRRGSRDTDDRVTFETPDELAVEFELPNRGRVRGMGIPAGITIIIGGGSQGKSTLLTALALGVYNHIPGDGRELIVTVPDAAGIRAEEGRHIKRVDISPFVKGVLKGGDTVSFSTEYASALESQAANIMEALEIGTSLILIDEDTSAANLMLRDARMQALIPKEEEPVTPLIDILPVLRDELNVSTVMVVSGCGDYFDCADTVIAMKSFQPAAVTAEAKKIALKHPGGRTREFNGRFSLPAGRSPLPHSLESFKKKQTQKNRPRGKGYVQYGDEFIDFTKIVQLASSSQARGIARGLALVYRLMDGSKSLSEAVDKVIKRVDTVGLDTLSNRCMGDLAGFRAHELAVAVNRLKMLKIK